MMPSDERMHVCNSRSETTVHDRGRSSAIARYGGLEVTRMAMCRLLSFLLIFAACTAASGQCPGTIEDWTPSVETYSAEEAVAVQASWDAICDELSKHRADEWAGYYSAAYHETNDVRFLWAPEAGFSVIWVGCIPGIHDANHGGVVETADGVLLQPQLGLRRRWNGSMGTHLVFVRWGQRRLLVPEHRMALFCEFTAGLVTLTDSDRHPFLTHEGDWSKPLAEVPDVPVAYRNLIRRPIDARITSVGKPRRVSHGQGGHEEIKRTVTLNKGSADGVRVDMEFFRDGDWSSGSVRVTKVTANESTAEFTAYVEAGKPNSDSPVYQDFGRKIRVGMVLSTRRWT